MKQLGIKILLLLCLGIILGGCQKAEEKVLTYEEVQQEMLDYLEHKYNEEFEVYGMDYKSWYNGGIETMLAYPKGENENNVFFATRTGENQITDDYVVFTMAKIYDKKVKEIVKQYFPEAVVQTGMFTNKLIPESFRPDMDINEFKKYANKVIPLGVSIYLVAETEADIAEEKVKFLIKELKDLNDIGSVHFLGYSSEAFDTYILNDPFNSEARNTSYSTNGRQIEKDIDWGQIDFDYEYSEDR